MRRAFGVAPPDAIWPAGRLEWGEPAPPWDPLVRWLGGRARVYAITRGVSLPSAIELDGALTPLVSLDLDLPWIVRLDAGQLEVLTGCCSFTVGTNMGARLGIPGLDPGELEAPISRAMLSQWAAETRLALLDDCPAARSVAAVRVAERPRTVLIAGHDLKFAQGFMAYLSGCGHRVLVDEWAGHNRHDETRSESLLARADAVLCEWALGNSVWYSHHRPPDTRLAVRLHLQEINGEYLHRMKHPDALIVVGPYMKRIVCRNFGFPERLVVAVPNAVRLPDTTAPHADVRRFTLGLVGLAPARKRLDLALNVLAGLRVHDPSFRLILKGKLPGEHEWLKNRRPEQRYFEEQFARVDHEPALRGGVIFSPFEPDLSTFWAQVGFALSTSDFESFHYTLPDGAAHGCVPLALPWRGADELYPKAWITTGVEDMRSQILRESRDSGSWELRSAQARFYVQESLSERSVYHRLEATVLGGR